MADEVEEVVARALDACGAASRRVRRERTYRRRARRGCACAGRGGRRGSRGPRRCSRRAPATDSSPAAGRRPRAACASSSTSSLPTLRRAGTRLRGEGASSHRGSVCCRFKVGQLHLGRLNLLGAPRGWRRRRAARAVVVGPPYRIPVRAPSRAIRASASRAAMYPPEIIAAVSEGDTQFVRRWLNKRTRDLNQTVNIYYGSLLLLCISNNYVDDRAELVQLLVANGADVRWENVAGFECLHWCHHRGEAVALLNGGADIDKQSHNYKITPLMMAARDDHFEVTRLLLHRGANLSMVDNYGHDAASHRSHPHLILEDNPSRELIRAVKRAGGWKPYVRAPRIELVRLRSLCARGRARPPWSDPVLQRLFSAPSSSKKATRASKRANRRPLPNEVLWHILGYWRSSREVGA